MITDAHTTCALARECDIGRIAAEAGDEFLEPEESGALVSERVVGFVAGGAEGVGG